MLRRIAIETTLVLTLTAALVLLAATLGLPGRTEHPGVEAAAEAPASSGSHGPSRQIPTSGL